MPGAPKGRRVSWLPLCAPVKRLAVAAALFGLLALPSPASAAAPCGYYDTRPVWIDFAATYWEPIAKPGVTLAASGTEFPARMRAKGVKTIYWDMYLRSRVGTPTQPLAPNVVRERAERLFNHAAASSGCPTPYIALNEMFGASLTTPWSATNAQYRENLLIFTRAIAARGGRAFVLISSKPYTGSAEAAQWWRDLAQVADIVQEVYFAAPALWRDGSVLANRRLRRAFRTAVGAYTGIGIPVSRIGLMLGFQTRVGFGGREGLQPSNAWFETIKWQALSARQVAAEMKIATVWSWGWGIFGPESDDPDKPRAACIYLWARSPSLCNGPAVADRGFNASRTDGQLVLPSGAQCKVGRSTLSMTRIARLTRLTGDREVAYTALLARLVESRRASVAPARVLAAESAVIAARFGGNRAAYRAALARSGADVEIARSVLADELRRIKIGRSLRVSGPSTGAIAGFYLAYRDLRARRVHATPAPWWLGGKRQGFALETFVPENLFAAPAGRPVLVRTLAGRYAVRPLESARPLATVPLSRARTSIVAVLTAAARDAKVLHWSATEQNRALRQAVCRRDDLPQPGSIELLSYLPFLALSA